jgi:hypothetical protein
MPQNALSRRAINPQNNVSRRTIRHISRAFIKCSGADRISVDLLLRAIFLSLFTHMCIDMDMCLLHLKSRQLAGVCVVVVFFQGGLVSIF